MDDHDNPAAVSASDITTAAGTMITIIAFCALCTLIVLKVIFA